MYTPPPEPWAGEPQPEERLPYAEEIPIYTLPTQVQAAPKEQLLVIAPTSYWEEPPIVPTDPYTEEGVYPSWGPAGE